MDTLLDRVRASVRFPLWKHRDEDTTSEEIDRKVDEIINHWSPLELLEAISYAYEEIRNDRS